jgi:hypothetical protein
MKNIPSSPYTKDVKKVDNGGISYFSLKNHYTGDESRLEQKREKNRSEPMKERFFVNYNDEGNLVKNMKNVEGLR